MLVVSLAALGAGPDGAERQELPSDSAEFVSSCGEVGATWEQTVNVEGLGSELPSRLHFGCVGGASDDKELVRSELPWRLLLRRLTPTTRLCPSRLELTIRLLEMLGLALVALRSLFPVKAIEDVRFVLSGELVRGRVDCMLLVLLMLLMLLILLVLVVLVVLVFFLGMSEECKSEELESALQLAVVAVLLSTLLTSGAVEMALGAASRFERESLLGRLLHSGFVDDNNGVVLAVELLPSCPYRDMVRNVSE